MTSVRGSASFIFLKVTRYQSSFWHSLCRLFVTCELQIAGNTFSKGTIRFLFEPLAFDLSAFLYPYTFYTSHSCAFLSFFTSLRTHLPPGLENEPLLIVLPQTLS